MIIDSGFSSSSAAFEKNPPQALSNFPELGKLI
jgi:hypothetical protein